MVALALLGTTATIVFAWELAGLVTSQTGRSFEVAAFAGLVKAISIVLQEILAAQAASKVKFVLRSKSFRKFAYLGESWRNQQKTSELNLLITTGLDALDTYFSKYLPQLVYVVLSIPIFLIVAFVNDFLSAIILAITVPLIPLFMVFIGWATQKLQNSQLEAMTSIATHFSEVVRGLTTLRVFNRANRQVDRLANLSETHRERTMKVLSLSFMSGFALELIASLSVALVAVTIGIRLLNGEIAFSLGLFILLLAPDVYLPLRTLGANFHASADGIASLTRLFYLFDTDSNSHDKTSTFKPQPGAITIIKGESGSGKTRLLKSMRSEKSAWMPQRSSVFSGTVLQNIVGRGEVIDDNALDLALKTSALDDLDLENMVGGITAPLSGGQLQRIGLARSIYSFVAQKKDTLLLDEPTSSQDTARIEIITSNLLRMKISDAAVVIVSHQQELFDIADIVHEVKSV